MRILISVIVLWCLMGGVVSSQSLRGEKAVSSIRVLNKSAMMHAHRDYWITIVSSPVGNETIPEIIKLGDIIKVKERTLRVRIIIATKHDKTFRYQGKVIARKGDTSCVIVESMKNLPSDEERSRLWIHAKQCEVLRQ